VAAGEVTLELKREFIDAYKDRAGIETCMTVDNADNRPAKARAGGALRFVGRSDNVELAIVGIMPNAADAPDAVAELNQKHHGDCVSLIGAWRLWCDRGGSHTFRQGAKLRRLRNLNSPHAFEIHPVQQVGVHDVADTWRAVDGYRMSDARVAFDAYSDTPCLIQPGREDTVVLKSFGIPYDYSAFIIEVLEDRLQVMPDGVALYASILDLQGRLINRERRLVFLSGTKAELEARDASAGQRYRVIGIPRISLKLIEWRIEHATDPREPLKWNLPYEIIAVDASAI